jgi:hypothetical protein
MRFLSGEGGRAPRPFLSRLLGGAVGRLLKLAGSQGKGEEARDAPRDPRGLGTREGFLEGLQEGFGERDLDLARDRRVGRPGAFSGLLLRSSHIVASSPDLFSCNFLYKMLGSVKK